MLCHREKGGHRSECYQGPGKKNVGQVTKDSPSWPWVKLSLGLVGLPEIDNVPSGLSGKGCFPTFPSVLAWLCEQIFLEKMVTASTEPSVRLINWLELK